MKQRDSIGTCHIVGFGGGNELVLASRAALDLVRERLSSAHPFVDVPMWNGQIVTINVRLIAYLSIETPEERAETLRLQDMIARESNRRSDDDDSEPWRAQ